MRYEHDNWVPIDEAAEYLQITVQRVQELIDLGELDWDDNEEGVNGGDLVMYAEVLSNERRESAGVESRKSTTVHARPPVRIALENLKSKIENYKLEPDTGPAGRYSTIPLPITVQEAADILGLSVGWIKTLMRRETIYSRMVGRRRSPILQDVEIYAKRRQRWAELGGRWTIYGKQPKLSRPGSKHQISGKPAEPDAVIGVEPVSPVHLPTSSPPQVFLRADYAAKQMGISLYTLRYYDRIGRIKFWITRRPPNILGPEPNRRGHCPAWISLEEMNRLMDEREVHRSRGAIPPSKWGHDLRRPIVRTKLEAAPGDRLISTSEAAWQLGICRQSVNRLIKTGRLFGWQETPGKHGCPVYLSENQVIRYRDDPDRLRRRAAATKPPEDHFEKEERDYHRQLNDPTNKDIWMEETGLLKNLQRGNRNSDRDRGEFFTAAQAAEVMRISRTSVLRLRRRGRLPGYHRSPTHKRGFGHKWWFFRKDDVYDLLADKQYRENNRRMKGGRAAKSNFDT